MTATTAYSCNICFQQTGRGYTIVLMPGKENKGSYHLSSIKSGLRENREQVSAAGAMISHVCENCAKDIYSEYYKNQPKAK